MNSWRRPVAVAAFGLTCALATFFGMATYLSDTWTPMVYVVLFGVCGVVHFVEAMK